MAGQPSISIVDTTNFKANKTENTQRQTENTTSGSTQETNTSQPQIVLRHDSFIKAIVPRAMSLRTSVGTLLVLCCHQLRILRPGAQPTNQATILWSMTWLSFQIRETYFPNHLSHKYCKYARNKWRNTNCRKYTNTTNRYKL